MDLFSAREVEIFESLRALRGLEFVVIGGYAVSAYTLPRFSVDCDLVVKSKVDAEKIKRVLIHRGYILINSPVNAVYASGFQRFEKRLISGLKASFDILIGQVFDRRTGASFSADWAFSNSALNVVRGKTFQFSIETRVINLDALAVMKLVSSRKTDLRDVFMLVPFVKDFNFVKREVSSRTSWDQALKRVASLIFSADFKKNLEGVYGAVNIGAFVKHTGAVEKLFKT